MTFFLRLGYNNKQVVLIPNMSSIVYNNRSKVMSILILKIWKFKADFGGGKQLKTMTVTKDLPTRC